MIERKKERKQTTQGRDGRTVHRHHTGILRRGECGAIRHLPTTLGRLPLPISLRSLSPILAATLMPPRGLPTLVVLPPVASSSVAPLSSASFCSATAACRSLALAASPASRRSSALLAAYFGPSSLSSSPLARTTLLAPTPIICRPVMLLLRSTLSSIHFHLYRWCRHWGSLRVCRDS